MTEHERGTLRQSSEFFFYGELDLHILIYILLKGVFWK